MTDAVEATEPAVRLPIEEWLRVLDADYIDRYVKDGGAAVKVALGDDYTRRRAMEGIHQVAKREGFVAAHVDATTCKVHLVNNLFNKVAESIPWRELARDFVREGLAARHYASEGPELDLPALAAQHGVDVSMLRKEVNQLLTDQVLADKQLTREMRMAVVQLCQASIETTDQSEQALRAMEEWLRGELRYISALKTALIFRKVNRQNGRGLINSLGAWARMASRPGLVLTVDISRYLDASADPNVGFRYSRLATLEAYELVRQFVDGTDEMVGTLMVFLSGPEFATDDKRGMRAYDALRLRLYDDVRDRVRPNPMSSMVALG